MMDARGRVLLRLVDIGWTGIGLAGHVQRPATDNRAAACRDAEFGKGHFHRHKRVLFNFTCADQTLDGRIQLGRPAV
jgi:hypothetical protein